MARRVRRLFRGGRVIDLNAGHGLHYANVREYIEDVPHLHTLNIGHAIIARALFDGLPSAVREMRALMVSARGR